LGELKALYKVPSWILKKRMGRRKNERRQNEKKARKKDE